ncbi:MAG: selenoprotein W-related protein [Pirellulaceae bacterium]|jgi:selenoprotein W-related protein
MAEQLLAKHTTEISGCTLVPSTGGCFEVSIDGNLVYSKLQSGQFPDFEEVDRHV